MIIASRAAAKRSTAPALMPDPIQRWSAGHTIPQTPQSAVTLALLGADIAAILAAIALGLAATSAANGDGWSLMNALTDPAAFISAVGPVIACALAVLAYLGGKSHYQQRVPFWTVLQAIVLASLAALLAGGWFAVQVHERDAALLPAVTWLCFPVAALIARKLVRSGLSAAGLWTIRTVVIGDPAHTSQTLAALGSEPVLGYDVVAVLKPGQLTSLSPARRWRTLLQNYGAGLIVLSYDASTAPNRGTMESLVRERVPFAVMPQGEGLPVLGYEQTRFFSHDTVMFSYRNNLAQPWARAAKVAFDVAAAGACLIVIAPVLAVIAALVKLDGGTALYGHVRIGAGGRPFRCLKFRSMVPDSDAVLRRVLTTDPAAAAEWNETQKLRNDPRITKIGRILRVTSLDELPQLFNVLRLEMSLVGPRPIVEAEIARYGDDIAYYYETRPGLTGLWQVSGRTGTSYAQRVQLDTWYVKNWTIWHDVAIIAKTFPAVLKRRGAC